MLAGAGAAIAARTVVGREEHRAAAALSSLGAPPRSVVIPGFPYHAADAAPGMIPAIVRPRFDAPAVASHFLEPGDAVVGVDVRGDARAYPVKLLALHEAVNDVVGGRPLVVTWCPLCSSALVFDRRVAGKTLVFRVSGLLYRGNQVLVDDETRSLWSQLAEGAAAGPMRGRGLELVAAVQQPWSVWRVAHPDTRVLSIRHDTSAWRFLHPVTYFDDRGEESTDDPYAAYAEKVSRYHGSRIEGVSGATHVVAILLGGAAKAYPRSLLVRRLVVDDTVAGVPLSVFWSNSAGAPRVFSRRLDARVLQFRRDGAAIRDTETGSRWSASTGTALTGDLAGKTLQPLPFTYPYWFAWHAFHPGTAIARNAGR